MSFTEIWVAGVLKRNLCPKPWLFRASSEAGVDINEYARLDLLLTTVGVALRFHSRWLARGYRHQTMQGSRPKGSGSMALADVDGDGDVDLYVAYNRSDDIRDRGRVNLQRVGNNQASDLQDRITSRSSSRIWRSGHPL